MTSLLYTAVASTLVGASLIGRTVTHYYYTGNSLLQIPKLQLSLTSSLSSLAYMSPKEVCQRAEECNLPFNDQLIYINDQGCDCQAYMWQRNNSMFLVFRGTEDLMDVLIDLDVRTEPITIDGVTVNVHQGFHRQFFAVESQIRENITNMMNNGATELIITGHSLGGALASIATYYYSKTIPSLASNITTYTYGSPRVGDSVFANDQCHTNGYRIFNYYDPIPMVPITGRYEHVNATPLCIMDSGIFCNPPIYVRSGKNDINPLLRGLMLFRLTPLCAKYHSIDRYRDLLL